MSADYQKGLEKIVLERKKESMRSARIGQLVAESLGGDIDSRKEIDLWLLQIQHKFYKHVNKWNMTTTKIKKQTS